MSSRRVFRVLAAATMLAGCSSASTGGGGEGGSAGHSSGGASAGGGGGTSSGGSGQGGIATGGATGSGGSVSGGTSDSGGQTTGGSTGTGGGSAGTGGSTAGGQGGSSKSGGAGGGNSGGSSGTGGGTGAGGAGSGGTKATGGSPDGGAGIGSGGAPTGGATGKDGGATGGAPGSGGGSGTTHWVGTWSGAPQLVESSNNPPAALSNSTLRQVVHVSLGGSQIRVRFSNEFSTSAVTISKAHVAVCKATPLVDSTIDTSTDKPLVVSGKESFTIAAKQVVWSDPLDFTLAPLSNLSVSIAYGAAPAQGDVTGHPGSRTTSYQVTGSSDQVSAASMSSAQTAAHWYTISGVDVMADASAQGIVFLGDSITDGKGSENTSGNNNKRWPDDLAVRLQSNAATANVAVMNQGIGGNVVQGSGLGPSAVDRFSRDVLGQSGVRWLIVFEGTNDIGSEGSAASAVTSAFDSFITQAHAKNILVYGATVTPFGGNSYYSAAHETVRQSVNTYIKSGKFDAYIDFDAALTDGGSPPKLKSTYDSGDGLHPSVAGHQKLADTVDLTLFTK